MKTVWLKSRKKFKPQKILHVDCCGSTFVFPLGRNQSWKRLLMPQDLGSCRRPPKTRQSSLKQSPHIKRTYDQRLSI